MKRSFIEEDSESDVREKISSNTLYDKREHCAEEDGVDSIAEKSESR